MVQLSSLILCGMILLDMYGSITFLVYSGSVHSSLDVLNSLLQQPHAFGILVKVEMLMTRVKHHSELDLDGSSDITWAQSPSVP